MKRTRFPVGFREWQEDGYIRVHGYIDMQGGPFLDLPTFALHDGCECREPVEPVSAEDYAEFRANRAEVIP